MMERTNVSSQKMAMQIILKDVLQSKYRILTNEFISNLQAKGVHVVFQPGISWICQRYILQLSRNSHRSRALKEFKNVIQPTESPVPISIYITLTIILDSASAAKESSDQNSYITPSVHQTG
jgi:hypothetical protein